MNSIYKLYRSPKEMTTPRGYMGNLIIRHFRMAGIWLANPVQGREFARGRLGGGEFGQILFKMATNLSDFRGQKIAFVFEWLQENGLFRLKQVFEGKKLYYCSLKFSLSMSILNKNMFCHDINGDFWSVYKLSFLFQVLETFKSSAIHNYLFI